MSPRTMITVTHQRVLELLDYDPETGLFAWKNKHYRQRNGDDQPGSISPNGRRYILVDRKQCVANRLAWFHVTGEWPIDNVVPKNGDYLDTRFGNLRLETQAETVQKSKSRAGTVSGTRGVVWDGDRNKWQALITHKGEVIHLGRFDTKEDASRAYNDARMELTGLSVADVERIAAKRDELRLKGRYRRLWRRTLKNAGGVMGWNSFAEFMEDIGHVEWRPRSEIVALEPNQPIGPENWKWGETLASQFDLTTSEGRKAYDRAHRAAYPMIHRNRLLQRDFGLTLEEYNHMLIAQGGVCACCGNPETDVKGGRVRLLAVDHCHDSNAIRCLLCGNCNRGIGCFKDDVVVMGKAIEYLKYHAERIANPETNVITFKKQDRP